MNNQIAKLTITQFHDLLSTIGWIQSDDEQNEPNIEVELIPENFEPYKVEGFKELHEPLSAEEHQQMVIIATKLNKLLAELRDLDCEFHDICDCR